jgi:hypothetical protein
MSITNTVPNDVATRHVLVTTEAFPTRSGMGFAAPATPKGFVLAVAMLGQTNVHVGQGPRHSNATLIENATAVPGDVLPDDVVAAGIAAAAAKQALVPEQIAAREAQAHAARAADPPLTAEQRAWVRAQHAAKPGGAP